MYRLYTFLFVLAPICCAAKDTGSFVFIENRGQVTDQYSRQRPDIRYSIGGDGVTAFIGAGSIHYQFSRPADRSGLITELQMYRVDMELVGANKNAEVLVEQQGYTEHYYLPHCPSGISASSATTITYKGIYPDIDWKLYVRDGKLEYDFILHKGARVADIKLRYDGASTIKLTDDGGLSISTPLGTIAESSPISYEREGKEVRSAFILQGNELSFDVGEHSGELVIDPAIEWGTYYGASLSEEWAQGLYVNDSGYVYMCGTTSYGASVGVIATVGAFQTVHAGGNNDGFVVKFDSNGVRQWGTYYGGALHENRCTMSGDHYNNIYLFLTGQSSGMATPGSHKEIADGASDVLLAKFNGNGERIWATYYGGTDTEGGVDIACGQGTDIYIAGITASQDGIATLGAFQETNADSGAAFLAKFDSSGVLVWGTYFSGDSSDHGFAVAADYSGNVYLAGVTESLGGLATTGSHQAVHSGIGSDCFLAKFNSSGQRIWATYYGGTETETSPFLACDSSDNVYMAGITSSITNIASTSGWQASFGGGANDMFLAKFDSAGTRQWGTYYGGSGNEHNYFTWGLGNMDVDKAGNCYLGGITNSTGMASVNANQSTLAGDYDGYFALFNTAGTRVWATYYGGPDIDAVTNIRPGGNNKVYVSGYTRSTSGITTVGSHQPNYTWGFSEALLAKFDLCSTYQPAIAQSGFQLDAGSFISYQWYFNGLPISGATSQFYTASQDGDYFAIVTDGIGCANNSDTVTITNTGIVNSKNEQDIKLYPNPATGACHISGMIAAGETVVALEVLDVMGRKVHSSEVQLNNGRIDKWINTSDLGKGTYIVRLVAASGTSAFPLTKQ